MANNHAEGFSKIPGVDLVGGVDTRPAQLAAFCEKHGIARGFASVDEALAWGLVDRICRPEDLLDQAHALTADAVGASADHVAAIKRLVP
jgi:hypothetical protein